MDYDMFLSLQMMPTWSCLCVIALVYHPLYGQQNLPMLILKASYNPSLAWPVVIWSTPVVESPIHAMRHMPFYLVYWMHNSSQYFCWMLPELAIDGIFWIYCSKYILTCVNMCVIWYADLRWWGLCRFKVWPTLECAANLQMIIANNLCAPTYQTGRADRLDRLLRDRRQDLKPQTREGPIRTRGSRVIMKLAVGHSECPWTLWRLKKNNRWD